MIDAWEYDYREQPARRFGELMEELNDLGADGWEAFSVVQVGTLTGSVTVLLKRRLRS